MLDNSTDTLARAGYAYAVGLGCVPALRDDFDLACFNAGIANANARHGLCVRKIDALSGPKQSGCESLEHDKTVGVLNY